MKAVVKALAGRGGLALVDMAEPEPRDGHLLVRVKAAAICGTDMHIYHWNDWAAANYTPPVVLGHELCGEVLWAPPGSGFEAGELVAVETHIACGRCYQCRRGEGHVCRELRLYSKSGYSAMAEMAQVPLASARRVPSDVGLEIGAVLEPLGVAVHAMELLEPAGTTVAVSGCGPIGLLAVAVARAMGARRVFAIDPVAYRRDLAEALGAEPLDPRESPPAAALASRTGGLGADLMVEASGKAGAIVEGLKALRRGGTAALVGLPEGAVSLDMAGLIITRGITLRSVFGRRIDTTWQLMEGLLASGRLDISPAITHRFPLSGFLEAFETADSGQAGKVLLIP